MKDGTTHLAYKAELAVDLESGALVAVTVQRADSGDTQTLPQALAAVEEAHGEGPATVVLDNVRKRVLIHACGYNLGVQMRGLTGSGTPRSLQGQGRRPRFALFAALRTAISRLLDRFPGIAGRLGHDLSKIC